MITTPRPEALPGDWAFRRAVNIVAADYEEGDLVILQFRDADTFVGREMRYYAEQLLPGARIVSLGDLTLNSADAEQHFATIVEPWLATRDDFWLIRSQEDALGDTSTGWIGAASEGNYSEDAYHEIGWVVISKYGLSSPIAIPYEPLPGPCDANLPLEFGSTIQLERCEVAHVSQPIDWLEVALRWRALANINADYVVYLHLIPSLDAPPVAQVDETPHYADDPLATYFWAIDAPIYDLHELDIPSDTPPGTYLLKLGLYDRVTLERLPVTLPDGSIADGVILAHITIE